MSKIRITLFGTKWALADGKNTPIGSPEIIEDRLIESETLFREGAILNHTGGMRIDALLENAAETEGLIDYLKQLVGHLPLSEKQQRKTKSQTEQPLAMDAVEQLVQDAFEKCKNQNQLIEYLRTLNFVFLTYENLKDICEHNKWPFELKRSTNTYSIDKRGKKHKTKGIKVIHGNYQWMVRVLKLAKNPLNDKIDPQIFFGVKLVGDLTERVQIYFSGHYHDTKKLDWDDTKVKFKKPEKFYKFPEPMSYKERSNWRVEDRKLQNDPEYQPTKFYLKWKEFVTILKPLHKKKK